MTPPLNPFEKDLEIWEAMSRIKIIPFLFGVGIILAVVCFVFVKYARAEEIPLKASWYSIASLKAEGTWKTSKGVMANGKLFNDKDYTCATRLYKLGSVLIVRNSNNGKSIRVIVTDRIGKRFAKTRIDLSKGAFQQLADLKQGLISVTVEQI